jgi:hypothetical protein
MIRVQRDRGWPWFRFQPFSLELDGSIVEKIGGGQSVHVPTPPGDPRVRVRFRATVWSDPVTLTLAEGEQHTLQCGTDWRGYPWLRKQP